MKLTHASDKTTKSAKKPNKVNNLKEEETLAKKSETLLSEQLKKGRKGVKKCHIN